jgi:NADPH:quinone reductase
MKAVGLYQYLPIENEQSLIDIEMDRPQPMGKDLLVNVRAISVNPVDVKVRAPKSGTETTPRILGWDAAGEVIAVGPEVESFAVGDQVFYAGDITRSGSNSEYQLVDERIVGRMPTQLDYPAAAALPLTVITTWEGLFDRLGISCHGDDEGKTILMIGGAGGVGSIAIQIASKLAKLKVIATASREESREWCLKFGANNVINHHNSLVEELTELGIKKVDYIFCLNNTDQHWAFMAKIIAPQGRICSIVETEKPVDLGALKKKSATFVWELMFTRPMYQTTDMIEQQRLLNTIADLVDNGKLVTTVNQVIRPISAKNLRQAHAQIEQGHTIGKVVLADWD